MAIPQKWKHHWETIKEIFSRFGEDNVFTHSAALSYYTIISLPPMVFVLLQIVSIFYGEATVREAFFNQVSEMVGQESSRQLSATLERLTISKPTWWATVIGVGVVLFTSTTVFATLQTALNEIFSVKAKPGKTSGILKMLMSRVISFAMLLVMAFILMVSLIIDTVIAAFGNYLDRYVGEYSAVFLSVISSYILPLAIEVVLFAMLFKVLPDAKLKWRNTWLGAFITAVLFEAGKYLISFYIGNSNVARFYDAAGGVMVLMVWVFYASAIVLFGAVVTNVLFRKKEGSIEPSDFAVEVKKKEKVVKKGADADAKSNP